MENEYFILLGAKVKKTLESPLDCKEIQLVRGQEEKGMTEDEMARWHHQLDGHEFEWTPGVGDGQGGLVCCNSWGRKELDTTEWLNWTESLKKKKKLLGDWRVPGIIDFVFPNL